jgi:hypothetical protein
MIPYKKMQMSALTAYSYNRMIGGQTIKTKKM